MNCLARSLLPALAGAIGAAAIIVPNANAAPTSERGQWIMLLHEQRGLPLPPGMGAQQEAPQAATRQARPFFAPQRQQQQARPFFAPQQQQQQQARAFFAPQQQQQARPQLASLQSSAPRSLGTTAPQRSIAPQFLPTVVDYNGKHKPGTIIIDTQDKFLYLVESGSKARRYGVGVGRPGFQWAGTHKISQKREWPGWTPPPQMRKRQPELPAFMPGGPDNPLGARALYLGSSLYRIHGSNQPWTIGHAVSSGCIRMRNEDVIDLYQRVGVGTRVIVTR